jgi:hypothetical protein
VFKVLHEDSADPEGLTDVLPMQCSSPKQRGEGGQKTGRGPENVSGGYDVLVRVSYIGSYMSPNAHIYVHVWSYMSHGSQILGHI